MPNFARLTREKPTFTPVEMQADYEAGGRQKDPWGVVADGFGELRQWDRG